MDDTITYMGYLWAQLDNGILTVGINEDGIEELGENLQVRLPEESDDVVPGKVCGEIETDAGPMNLYSPVAGTVIEVNEAVIENPSMILEDPLDDGWLFKIEAENPDQIDMVSLQTENEDDGDDMLGFNETEPND